jgi:hypothetical protein
MMMTGVEWCHPELLTYAGSAYANLATIQNTYEIASQCLWDEVQGDFVECGVAAGAQIGVMGHACREMGLWRNIWAFDSYCGIPLAGPHDDEQPGVGPVDPKRAMPADPRGFLTSSGIAAHPLAAVQDNLRRWQLPLEHYHFVKGWFQDTVPETAVERIALLRLDGDLYESTKVCLEHLFPRLQGGGYLIIDDYALAGCRRASDEYLAEHAPDCVLHPVDPDRPEVHWMRMP